jgi:hypothetical protein
MDVRVERRWIEDIRHYEKIILQCHFVLDMMLVQFHKISHRGDRILSKPWPHSRMVCVCAAVIVFGQFSQRNSQPNS